MQSMRRFLSVILVLLTLGLGGLAAGCAMVPAQEMSDARQAIEAAEAAGADARAPRAIGLARALLEQAQVELATQNYRAARRSARASKAAAIQAREAADDVVRSAP